MKVKEALCFSVFSKISLWSNGYDAGYIRDNFGCIERPCECAGIAFKDKTVIGMDFKCYDVLEVLKTLWFPLSN